VEVGACHMHARAPQYVKRNKTQMRYDPRIHARYYSCVADITFTQRLIPMAERQLISVAMLWPEVRDKVMCLSLGDEKPDEYGS
jgi:hypothetical protein